MTTNNKDFGMRTNILVDSIRQVERSTRENSPVILTALGVSGTLATAYLASKASYEIGCTDGDDQQISSKEHWRKSWKLYIPAALSGALTIGCIIASLKIGSKRAAAAYSLLTVSEQAFVEYKEKVVEQLGEKKEQKLRDEIAQNRLDNVSGNLVIAGSGHVVCFEQHTGRKFMCDIETLRQAQNTINAKCIREMEATLSDFYHMVGLPDTTYSSAHGWTSDKMLELGFSGVLSDGQPCIAFEYNYVKQL